MDNDCEDYIYEETNLYENTQSKKSGNLPAIGVVCINLFTVLFFTCVALYVSKGHIKKSMRVTPIHLWQCEIV